ncbi:hypothetical protein EDD21DRAFT_351382 [Dissophora ornata]|nr:hypothetical protein EDD21DRAFT_351382 [Dissophora ornata]
MVIGTNKIQWEQEAMSIIMSPVHEAVSPHSLRPKSYPSQVPVLQYNIRYRDDQQRVELPATCYLIYDKFSYTPVSINVKPASASGPFNASMAASPLKTISTRDP